MADPLTIIGGIGSIIQIIHSVTKVAKSLNDIRQGYKSVALNITLVASQLSTIRAALEALHTWRANDNVETEATHQLDQDLGLSLSCCAILITVIDGKLTEAGYTSELGVGQKIRYMWLEDMLKEYVSNLEGQVRALQLLLTIFQCRTATEQKQQLANQESREIIAQVRAETMTLGIEESDMDDAMSILSQDPSVHLDVDSILMKSPAYRRVYGGEKPESPRHKKLAAKPPPPPPRRKLPPRANTQTTPKTANTTDSTETPPPPPPKSIRPSPQLHEPAPKQETQQPTPPTASLPTEIAPQPPPITPPSTMKPPIPRQRTKSKDEGPDRSRARISRVDVWDFYNADQSDHISNTGPLGKTDAVPVFELHEKVAPTIQQPQTVESPLQITMPDFESKGSKAIESPSRTTVPEPAPEAITPSKSNHDPLISAESSHAARQAEFINERKTLSLPEQLHSLEPFNIEHSPRHEEYVAMDVPSSVPNANVQGEDHVVSEPFSSLEEFRSQLKLAFQEPQPSEAGDEGLGLSFTPTESQNPLFQNAIDTSTKEAQTREVKSKVDEDTSVTTSAVSNEPSPPVVPRTMSIHSDDDLYDASVKDMPMEEPTPPPSQPATNHEVIETGKVGSAVDDAEAQAEGLSVLNQHLAYQSSDIHHEDESTPEKAIVESELCEEPGKISKPTEALIEKSEQITTPPSASLPTPQITMTPVIENENDGHATNTPSQSVTDSTPASPSRAPPPPPARRISIPPIPYTSPNSTDFVASSPAVDTSTASSGRDSSTFEAASTISSSQPSIDNTTMTMNQSTANTAATSVSIDAASLVREQAQTELRRLQTEQAAAKARGDSKAAQASLQESIEVIRATYLGASTPSDSKKPRIPRLGSRASMIRFPSMPGSGKASALGNAAAAGELANVRSLLDGKVNIDARDGSNQTALMRAALNGHLDCMEVLKQRGADEFTVDALGRTVLHLAVASNRSSSVKWLLNAYPAPRPDHLKHRGSILFKATDSIMSRSPKNLRESSDAEGSKPVHLAVKSGSGEMLKILLDAGVNIEAKNNWGQTPLHQAIISNRPANIDTLLQSGANYDVGDARAMTPLHWAAKTGHVDIIGILLNRSADRYRFDDEGKLPIHQAAWIGHLLAMETLSLGPDDLRKRTKHGETLLHIACLIKNLKLATYLLDNGVDINPEATPQPTLLNSLSKFKVLGTSMTPLHYACCKADYEMALLLLDKDAWVNSSTPEGATALMLATESEDTNTVNLLLSRGAQVNANMPVTLITALHIAARRGDLETIQQLCRSGANDNARNDCGSYGRTPSEEATKHCTDKAKLAAVEDYFRTIRENKRRNARIRTLNDRQPYEMVGRANSTAPGAHIHPHQPVSYAPWNRHNLIPQNMAHSPSLYTQQQQWPSTYPQPIERAQTQPQMREPYEWYDPNTLTHVESPPPYQAGTSVSARLASQAAVYRPGDGVGPKYS